MIPKHTDPHTKQGEDPLPDPPNIGGEFMVWRVAGEFELSIREVDEWPIEDVLDANEYLDVQVDAMQWRSRYGPKPKPGDGEPPRLDPPR